MLKRCKRLGLALFFTLAILAAWFLPVCSGGIGSASVSAAAADYPAQLMHLAAKDNATVLTESGTADGASVSMKPLGSDLAASWRFDRIGADETGTFFQLVNAQSCRLLTPLHQTASAGNSVIMYGSVSQSSQYWYVIPVKSDHLGNGLYYKILPYTDTSLALTQGTSAMTLAADTGADNQLWLLNADGLQGFAGYCSNDNTNQIKAADIGGLFGETVMVSTFEELKQYATSDTPYTIVVTANLSVTSLTKDSSGRYYCPDGRIYVHSNKTIIGSYQAHTLYNVQFCTASSKGTGDNIMIRNFELQHDAESNGNDSIVVYLGSGQNLWVDHCTFVGHSDYNTASTGLEDWDKFLACCYDADYCTVSDCSFGLHEYGLILGYPADDETSYQNYNNYPCMSLIGNSFSQTLTRGPGLMRYGYFHSLNNYVDTFSMAYTVHTASKIYAENCYYSNGGNVICDWNTVTYPGSYAESGSVFVDCKRTTIEGYAESCTWRPSSNYRYTTLTAEEAKAYCTAYSGCQSAKSGVRYLRYAESGVPGAAELTAPSAPIAASFSEGAAYRIRNVNSGLYLQVADGAAKNGANIQQWGSDGTSVHDIWKFYSAGDGYYYLVSAVGDGGTYVLDVSGKKTSNGTNIDLYQFNGGTNQQFMLADNGTGAYLILTRVTGNASAVEVADASAASGANVQQWEVSGASCQAWELEPAADPGCEMDTNLIYTFENVHSGLVMDVADGVMADGTNIRQWEKNGAACQKWKLRAFGSGNYYWIRSYADESFAWKAEGSGNGGNLDLTAFSTKDSAQLFRFSKNPDGSYHILSHASKDGCLVEVESASVAGGANVQQWEATGSDCQNWNLSTEQEIVSTTEATSTAPAGTTSATTTTAATATTTTAAATTTAAETKEPVVSSTEIPGTVLVPGDVNEDGICSTADLVMLQKWLLGKGSLTNAQAGDMTQDGKVNGMDLSRLRQVLLQ